MAEQDKTAKRYVKKVSVNPEMSHNKILARIRKGSTVLEFGPASGAMTEVLTKDYRCHVSIIEIDEECFHTAMQYAQEGICANIETFEWLDRFQNRKFDYIIFADVLEHLRIPELVLQKAKQLLKRDGSLLISVPNIAHNSVIIQLLLNRFIYQNTGILDYTHIRHFTYSEIEQLCIDCGYGLVYMDAVYVGVGRNEFGESYADIDPAVAEVLKKRPFGEVYQHVLELKTKEYVTEQKIKIENCLGLSDDYATLLVNTAKHQETERKNVNSQIVELLCSEPNLFFEKNDEIARMRLEINEMYQSQPELQDVVRLREQIYEYQDEIKTRNMHIQKLDKHIQELDERIQSQDECIQSQNEHIRNLNSEIEHSFEYQLKKMVKDVVLFLVPPDSRRRFFLRVLKDIVKHPRRMLHVIKPSRVRNYWHYMKQEGMAGVRKRYMNVLEMSSVFTDGGELYKVELIEDTEKQRTRIEDFEKIVFPYVPSPVVSIIIPVYNEVNYTYNCLKAIYRNSGNISYEIIIANDCSTDLTTQIESIAENVHLITTKENMGFLRNCNYAAKYARGKYILFLNNDTQVQSAWLEPLVTLCEKDDSIGMTGSRLVYPDGRLQEAGGIVWKDASAWNYGNGQSPEESEFNYVKEADYISGASIMIRRSLWEEIGGFDERFAPAYCEDSDLAFEVRAKGYKVVYQPLSVVVHFEGISNGTDTNTGQKSYQVVNQKKFLEKWKNVLEKDHFENSENVFTARDRSRDKPVILMVDHYVPQYDKDAGSRTVFQYLRLFVDKGYNVKFIGDNFYRYEWYTTVLQQMGIEVLYGPRYANGWKDWVKTNGDRIQFVFLNRPHISVKYIDFIKNTTKARIIYYGHDLHFLRSRREYELTHDQKTLKESEEWLHKELELMHKADMVYYPSRIEVEEIARLDPLIKAKAIVAYIFDEGVFEEYHFNTRKDIMFVGGFTHTPNVDAVMWFVKEIFPTVSRMLPEVKLYILGSNPPPEIENLTDENVIVKGFVTDEELEKFYKNCRISVVPLRYGAGIKGKVIEAMNWGIPVLTTSIGAEGITGAEEILCIEDQPEKFGEALVNLYNDEKRLIEMSAASHAYIKNHFTAENAWDVIGNDFLL